MQNIEDFRRKYFLKREIHLGGSRMLGYATENSDFDFFGPSSAELYKELTSDGFAKVSDGRYFDLNTDCILAKTLPSGEVAQVALVYDPLIEHFSYKTILEYAFLWDLHRDISRRCRSLDKDVAAKALEARKLIWHTLHNLYLITTGREPRNTAEAK
jgi:hypothetical protein